MIALTENLLLTVASYITDPVTTTDELIPSGETSSYRSNPLRLAEFALGRKDPAYVGRAKAIQAVEKLREKWLVGETSADEEKTLFIQVKELYPELDDAAGFLKTCALGSLIYAVKPGTDPPGSRPPRFRRYWGDGPISPGTTPPSATGAT